MNTVTVTNEVASLLDTNYTFAATVNLPLGTNIVPVVATDVNGNSATNNYSVTVVGDLGKAYLYDLNGNCTNVSMTGTNIIYEWDAENRLVAINTYVTNTATLTRSEFTYDGFDRWVQIVEKTNGVVGSTKRFVWCGGTTPNEERDANNTVQKRFFTEGEQINEVNYFIMRDRLGNVREMVDAAENVRAKYDYDPYGRQTKLSGDMDADFGFAGYYRHAPSGLELTWQRAYDPDRGWINRDPIEERGGLNLYDYVNNNPVNARDPTGQEWQLLVVAGLVGIGVWYAFEKDAQYKDKSSHQDTSDPEELTKRQQGMGSDMVDCSQAAKTIVGSIPGGTSLSLTPVGVPDTGPKAMIGWYKYSLGRYMNYEMGKDNAPPNNIQTN